MVTATDERIQKQKEEILTQLAKTPIVQVVVERVGVGRSSFYRWKSEDGDFAKKVEKALSSGKELVNDLAETQLINNIKNGNMTAIIYWLKSNHPTYSENHRLNENEMKEIIGLFGRERMQEDEYQTLACMILEKKIPINIARILNFLFSSLSKGKKEEIVHAREKLVKNVLFPSRE